MYTMQAEGGGAPPEFSGNLPILPTYMGIEQISSRFTHFNVAQITKIVKLLELRAINHVMPFILLYIEGTSEQVCECVPDTKKIRTSLNKNPTYAPECDIYTGCFKSLSTKSKA